jgi:hypothetical protein
MFMMIISNMSNFLDHLLSGSGMALTTLMLMRFLAWATRDGYTVTLVSDQKDLAELSNKTDNSTHPEKSPERKKLSQRITKTLPKIDSFLIHDFNFNIIEEEENLHGESSSSPFLLPMIIEISNPNWDSKVPDYREFYRTEYMVSCYGSIETIKVLSEDPDVIRVKVADVG